MNSLVDHWRYLAGPVHPQDAGVFQRRTHSFNLDFPPPAFIGDILNAPVILLDANGGYDRVVTPSEFPDQRSHDRYLELLHRPRAVGPGSVAPYYGSRNYGKLIADGVLALVNAVAYRSSSISREPDNRQTAELLPSTHVHRMWLRRELLSDAASGSRLVIAHRTSLWKIRKTEGPFPGVHFTTNPVSADLSKATLEAIHSFV